MLKKIILLSFVLSAFFLLPGCANNAASNPEISTPSGLKIGEVNILGIGEETPSSSSDKKASTLEVSYQGENGKTAFALLQEKAKVEFDKTDFGVMVASIDGVKNDNSAKKYWLYYVNDKMASVAADKYMTKEGDEIVWKYGE